MYFAIFITDVNCYVEVNLKNYVYFSFWYLFSMDTILASLIAYPHPQFMAVADPGFLAWGQEFF